MAFHTPDPKLRAIEKRNAELRAQTFAWAFRALKRRTVRCVKRLTHRLTGHGAKARRRSR